MKRWHFWVGLLISVIFLFIALRGLQITDVWEGIKTANFIWLIPAIAIYFIAVWVRAFRWYLFLRPIKEVPIYEVFPIVTIGYMGNNIYPARAGEILRAIVLKHKFNIPVSGSLATIIIERIIDGVIMLGFIILNLSNITTLPGAIEFTKTIHTVTLWGSIIFISALFIFLLAAIFPGKTQNILFLMIGKTIPKNWRGNAQSISQKFIEGLRSLSSPMNVIKIFLVSIIIWLLETGFYWFTMRAFPFKVSFSTLMLMNGVLNLFTVIPSTPGYIGTFDAPGIAMLTAFGINSEISASYILLLHAALWLPVTFVGGLFFGKAGLDWGKEINQANMDRES
ncbi:MAG: flippase-like domain-containing protein [Candidatus Marinimicrobia bacterium]|nr:flippase-like domain-containing protein [Candidatus Neomarinimicrobiota bacterium]